LKRNSAVHAIWKVIYFLTRIVEYSEHLINCQIACGVEVLATSVGMVIRT